MDQLAGEVLDRLEQDGLADDTLVVFWSDHGMAMPRGKRWIYDTGTRIPMIIRWPGKVDAGSLRKDLVSVLDLPPTMLSMAGVEVPDSMHGRVLMGENAGKEPPYLFFHRDRMDEVVELQRGARDRRWKYIRNYEPQKPYAQRLDYMDEMPAMQDWRRLAAEKKLTGTQQNWFSVPKPIEELYDTAHDGWELNNLAELPQYAERLARMREATETWQREIGDTGLIPEAVMMEEMKPEDAVLVTQVPTIRIEGGFISLRCETDGASIVYQYSSNDSWSPWQLYTKSFADPGVPIRVLGCRLGYHDSEMIVHSTRPDSPTKRR